MKRAKTVDMFKASLVAILVLGAAETKLQAEAPPPFDPVRMAAAEQIIGQDFAAHPNGSLTIGIVSGPRLAWTRSYGFANEATKAPATRDTVYRIGSVTKQFTGVMLLQLVQHHRISLSDRVDTYFPAIDRIQGGPPPKPITFLDLATHRSGLSREPDGCIELGAAVQCRDVIGPVPQWERILTAALPRVKLERAPDTAYAYSNIGYAVLGAALSRAVKTPYIKYVAENIFAPLRMTHTAFEPTPEMSAVLATGYSIENGVADPTIPTEELKNGRGYKVPNGAIFTTVDDLAKFVSFEMGYGPEAVLPHGVLAANYQRSFPVSDKPGAASYGIGFSKQRAGGRTIIGHNGAVAGYTAGAFFDPDAGVGIVCFRNSTVPCGPIAIKALVALIGN